MDNALGLMGSLGSSISIFGEDGVDLAGELGRESIPEVVYCLLWDLLSGSARGRRKRRVGAILDLIIILHWRKWSRAIKQPQRAVAAVVENNDGLNKSTKV